MRELAGRELRRVDLPELHVAALGQVAQVESESHGVGGADSLYGNAGDDVLIGGFAGDTIRGGNGSAGAAIAGSDADLILGDNARIVDLVSLSTLRAASIATAMRLFPLMRAVPAHGNALRVRPQHSRCGRSAARLATT